MVSNGIILNNGNVISIILKGGFKFVFIHGNNRINTDGISQTKKVLKNIKRNLGVL